MAKGIILGSFLILVLHSDPAHAYVDPTSSRVALHVISGVFIVVSASFIFLKNQFIKLFEWLRHLMGRLLRRGRDDRER